MLYIAPLSMRNNDGSYRILQPEGYVNTYFYYINGYLHINHHATLHVIINANITIKNIERGSYGILQLFIGPNREQLHNVAEVILFNNNEDNYQQLTVRMHEVITLQRDYMIVPIITFSDKEIELTLDAGDITLYD